MEVHGNKFISVQFVFYFLVDKWVNWIKCRTYGAGGLGNWMLLDYLCFVIFSISLVTRAFRWYTGVIRLV